MNIDYSRVLRGLVLLIGSSGVAAACALASLGLNTRSLGTHDFGVLSLIQAFVALASGLTSFESWQPVVRLGTRMPRRLPLTISCAMLLDAIAAAFAAIMAIIIILLSAPFVGIDSEYKGLAVIYSLCLLAGLAGTPKGYFRLRQEFHVLAANQAGLAIGMLAVSLALWWFDAALPAYVIAFAAVTVFYNLSLLFQMLASIRSSGSRLFWPLATRNSKKHFLLVTKLSIGSSVLATLISSRRHIALFMVGHLLGSSGAGIYSVAAKLVTAASRFTSLLNQIMFPEFIRSASRIESRLFARSVAKVSAVALFIGLLVASVGGFLGEPIIRLVSGQEYVPAARAFGLLLAAECLGMASVHFNPIIQGAEGPVPLIRYQIIGSLTLVLTGWWAIQSEGVYGAALAVLACATVAYIFTACHVLSRFLFASNGYGEAVK